MTLASNTPIRINNNRKVQPYYGDIFPPMKAQVKLPASVIYLAGTCLGEVTGTTEVQSITITGGPTGGTFTLTYGGLTTAAIAYNATAATVEAALAALANLSPSAQWTIAMSGSPTGGTFRLAYDGFSTIPIAYNASAAVVQAALEGLPTIGTGNVAVTGTDLTGTLTVTFQGSLAGTRVPAIGSNTFQLAPTTAGVTLTQINQGGGIGQVQISGTNPAFTATFNNSLADSNVAAMTASGAGLTGGTTPGVTIATPTGGAAGTTNLYTKCSPNAVDGSQVISAILETDCATDANGNVTYGRQTGGGAIWGDTNLTAPVYKIGIFNVRDLLNLDSRCFGNNVRQYSGDLNNGLIRLR